MHTGGLFVKADSDTIEDEKVESEEKDPAGNPSGASSKAPADRSKALKVTDCSICLYSKNLYFRTYSHSSS